MRLKYKGSGKEIVHCLCVDGDYFIDHSQHMDTKLMREYLGNIRKEYLTKAPVEWVKEFGKDIVGSLPRMASGVVAMHGPQAMISFVKGGFNV